MCVHVLPRRPLGSALCCSLTNCGSAWNAIVEAIRRVEPQQPDVLYHRNSPLRCAGWETCPNPAPHPTPSIPTHTFTQVCPIPFVSAAWLVCAHATSDDIYILRAAAAQLSDYMRRHNLPGPHPSAPSPCSQPVLSITQWLPLQGFGEGRLIRNIICGRVTTLEAKRKSACVGGLELKPPNDTRMVQGEQKRQTRVNGLVFFLSLMRL